MARGRKCKGQESRPCPCHPGGCCIFQTCPGLGVWGWSPREKIFFSPATKYACRADSDTGKSKGNFFWLTFLVYLSESSRSVEFSNTTGKQRTDHKSGEKRVSHVNSCLLHDRRKLRQCGLKSAVWFMLAFRETELSTWICNADWDLRLEFTSNSDPMEK